MIKVKICGLKSKQDIRYVNQLRPDYVGFVFTQSTRQIDQHRAKELIEDLDKSIKKVGVFLNTPINEVKEIAHYCDLDILQFHGDEDPLYCQSFDQEVWKGFRIKGRDSLKQLREYPVDGFLLDTFVKGQYGGTGKAFKWDIVTDISQGQFVILAGGLTSENVKQAIETAHPKVVDISSGVEINGAKDFEKMKEFIEKVREII